MTKRSAFFFVFMLGCASNDAAAPVQEPDNGSPVVTSATASASTPPPPPTVQGDKPPPEMQAMLDAHNRLRAQHCAAPLVWSDTVARAAKTWVDKLASKGCMLQHSETNYGENISGGSSSTQTPDQVASMWYRENASYDFAHGGFSMRSGHFTQVVWRGSQRLGCAAASCGNDMRLWVCNYDPPGNMQGDFQRNVLPTSCKR